MWGKNLGFNKMGLSEEICQPKSNKENKTVLVQKQMPQS